MYQVNLTGLMTKQGTWKQVTVKFALDMLY